MKTRLLLITLFILGCWSLSGQIIVTNTNNDGAGSLRQAIVDANATAGTDSIHFNIPGEGPHTIQPTSPLPEITDPVIIDGYTQEDATVATSSSQAVLMIEIDGSVAGSEYNTNGLEISSGLTTIRGLVINNFTGTAIRLFTNGNNLIEGNFIGTDASGSQQSANDRTGIWALSDNNTIGGISPENRNIISNNGYHGIMVSGQSTTIQGNFIGTDITGTIAMGNNGAGIFLRSGAIYNQIGGPESGAGNLISGNVSSGIFINRVGISSSPSSNIIQGNYIGTDVSGAAPLGNGGHGISIQDGRNHLIGGNVTAEGNIIAFNGASGVWIRQGTGNAILSNSIFSNGNIGIDLEDFPNYVTPNDPGDVDSGPNNYQNFTELISVTSDAGNTTIEGSLNSTPNTSFTIQFFSNVSSDPSGFGEGETFIGSTIVNPGQSGYIAFNVVLPVSVQEGEYITATVTSSDDNTSEFSEAFQVGSVQEFPVAIDDLETTNEDNSITIDVLFNDLVAEDESKALVGVSAANNGSVVIESNDNLTYTPNPDFFGADHFYYTMQNGSGETDQALVAITINEVNDPPLLSDDIAITRENTPVIIPVLENDIELDNDPLIIENIGNTTSGTTSLNDDNTITYSPNSGFNGVEYFTYTVSDGRGGSSVAQITVAVFDPVLTTWVVNSADDIIDGVCDANHCNLREAILTANSLLGTDNIHFNIPGTGPHILQPTSPLPEITEPLVLDAYTQPGAVEATSSTAAVLMIELDGSSAGSESNSNCLEISAGSTTIRGLAINSFAGSAIRLTDNGNNLIEGNFIGTDASGGQQKANIGTGVWVLSNENTIGGSSPDARNIISNNGYHGIMMSGYFNIIKGNLIGTDVNGTLAMSNSGAGMFLRSGSHDNIIGGPEAGAGNVISGNESSGIFINRSPYSLPPYRDMIQGNLIGTDVTGTSPLGNGGHGISIQAGNDLIIGGSSAAEGNIIAYNGSSGVWIYDGDGNSILSNSIFSNGKIGIDLADFPNFVTPNDPGDVDTGPNDFQNYPELSTVTGDATSITIGGNLHSSPTDTFNIQFFYNTVLDPTGNGEGENYIGETTVITDVNGDAQINATFPVVLPQGSYITSTATHQDGNTSEFSAGMLSNDVVPPVLAGVPADINAECDDIPDPATVTAEDDVDGTLTVALLENINPGSCLNAYTIVRTWTAIDAAGNVASASQIITVDDNTPPVAPVPPSDLILSCASDVPPPIDLTAVDNCSGEIIVSPSATIVFGDCDNEFTMVRTWTFEDVCGNATSVSQTITVLDNEAPVLTTPVPADLMLGCIDDVPPPVDLTAVDNCSGTMTVSPSATITFGDCDNEFTMVRTWTFADVCGNATSVSQTITVLDNEAPVLTAPVPADLMLGCIDDVPPPVDLTAVDNCSGTMTVSPLATITFGDCDNEFTMVRTWTFADVCGNATSVSQTITVLDNEAPVLTAPIPADLMLSCIDDVPPPVDLTAVDNCSGTMTVSPSATITFGDCDNEFTMVRTWTFEDVCGNATSVSQTITVLDNEAPVLTTPVPADLMLGCIDDVPPPVDLTAVDNCSGTMTVSPSATITFGDCDNEFTMVRTWTFEDVCGNVTSVSQTITVLDNIPPEIGALPSVEVGNDPGTCGAVVYYPDIIAIDNCAGDVEVTIDPPSGSFFPVGISTVSVYATDNCGNIAASDFSVLVSNIAPEIISVSAPVDPIQIETDVNVTAVFEDDNVLDAYWDWGDGNITSGLISGNNITGVYQYFTPGVYTLTLTVTDLCGDTHTKAYQYIVIYNPSGGFVIGAGWIYSEAGAYVPDPTLQGRANFGFVAKYKKGTTTPIGNAEFRFRTGDLDFASTAYDWLVVAGEKAKFKGEGTINNMGAYGFMLSAVDGTDKENPDKFRIKIWEMATENVIYDNQLGDADDSDATDAIEGGSIKVHNPKLKDATLTLDIDTDDPDAIEAIKVYPNPVTDKLNVKMSQEFIESDNTFRIHLFNVVGADMLRANILNNTKDLLVIDMSDMPYGLYTLVIQINNTTYRNVIIKE